MHYKLVSQYSPTGDQPEAIQQLTQGLAQHGAAQTLLGVTGSGKTFTVANVIKNLNVPTLVLSHNKTLAAQLYGEFKTFFPHNAVEYFVSYYDYYQPEAYLPTSDLYIAKDMAINEEIEKLRLKATASLLSGRNDVIVVSSVSCIYGMANPASYASKKVIIRVGDMVERDELLRALVDAYYVHNKEDFKPGVFRAKGDTIDIFPAVEGYDGIAYRVEMWGDEVERISSFNPITQESMGELDSVHIYPANLFVTTESELKRAIELIKTDLAKQVSYFEEIGKETEAARLQERVQYDLDMLKEVGYCSGIENYSRYFDGRKEGERPFCLLDYFPANFLLVIDESHVTVPQLKAMYSGDRFRKQNLVDYGFRLPAAIDNRPLKLEEFEEITDKAIYVSATPAEYELEKSNGIIVEQIIRPTGLPDPIIDVRPTRYQIDDLVEEINKRVAKNERTLVTTLTKRMAEELSEYLSGLGVKCKYIHSEIDTLERVQIIEGLRMGEFDALIGVNLLREGLDLPEVSLVAILDADKEGFLRSHRSLTQTAGRAARNLNGLVIFYADNVTDSMQQTINETNRRREKQLRYNEKHGIIPRPIVKKSASILNLTGSSSPQRNKQTQYATQVADTQQKVAETLVPYGKMPQDLNSDIEALRRAMKKASDEMDFITAAQYRDRLFELEALASKSLK